MTEKIKFGVMCQNMVLKEWQFEAINKILNLSDTSIELFIVNDETQENLVRNNIKKTNNLFWNAFIFLNNRRFKANRHVDLSLKFKNL